MYNIAKTAISIGLASTTLILVDISNFDQP